MKKYVVYKTMPAPDGGTVDIFLKENQEFSYDPKDAKVHKIKNIIEIIVFVLQLILKFGNLKYKKV